MHVPPSLTLRKSYEWHGFQTSSISLSFSTDGRILASASLDSSLKLFDVTSGMPISSILLDPGVIPVVVHWTDKNIFLLSTSDALITSWIVDVDTRQVALQNTIPRLFPAAVHKISTRLTGKDCLLIAVYDNNCEAFRLTNGIWRPRSRVTSSGGSVLAAEPLSNTSAIIIFREDAPRFWDITTNELSHVPGWQPETRIHSVTFYAASANALKSNQDGDLELVLFVVSQEFTVGAAIDAFGTFADPTTRHVAAACKIQGVFVVSLWTASRDGSKPHSILVEDHTGQLPQLRMAHALVEFNRKTSVCDGSRSSKTFEALYQRKLAWLHSNVFGETATNQLDIPEALVAPLDVESRSCTMRGRSWWMCQRLSRRVRSKTFEALYLRNLAWLHSNVFDQNK
ncbi:hypothetical protein AURDEDRAFT_175248 [Auricularia subglabra TFB-10046 SS5]|nr:hypothetical protein AURDEDRAFT_175248 [Auricularia subglabra TFB-10046 SS5]